MAHVRGSVPVECLWLIVRKIRQLKRIRTWRGSVHNTLCLLHALQSLPSSFANCFWREKSKTKNYSPMLYTAYQIYQLLTLIYYLIYLYAEIHDSVQTLLSSLSGFCNCRLQWNNCVNVKLLQKQTHCCRTNHSTHTRVDPKVSGLAAWSENCKWYSSLPPGTVVSLFCESV
jgi:hypothetical protein